MTRSLNRFVCAAMAGAAMVLLCSASVHAQAVTGTLLGNVTDQSGLALPGATVTITETSTNISLNTATNEAATTRSRA